jgi:outer membrane receptor protein involved in Fe transport
VDSRRHVPTNQGDGVDLNFIPSVLIERMEVVTGGASASYGSGALSGVTNILLDRDLDGGKIQIDYAETQEGDGGDTHIAFAWGSEIGENGHFIIGVEGQDADEIPSCHIARDWCAQGTSLQTNGAFATNDQPHRIKVSGVRGGLSTNGHFPILGVTFTDESASATRPFNGPGAFNVGGEGRHIYAYNQLRSQVDREVVYAAYNHDITEDLSFFLEASVGSVETFSPQSGTQMNFQFINADNYYLNNLAVNPCVGIEFLCFYSKDFSEEVLQSNTTTTDMERFTAGLSGRFGASTWTWDVYFQTGESDRLQ